MSKKLLLPLLLLGACVSVPNDDLRDVTAQRGIVWTPPQTQGELTADQAVAIALTNNPRLQVALAESGIARAELIEASTIANPIFEFEIRFPGAPYRPYELRLAQSLIDLVQLPRRRAAGRAAYDAAQMRVASAVLNFAADVRGAYYDVVAEQQHEALSRTAFEAAQAAVEVAMKQHAAENITDLELENEQASYEQAKLDHTRAAQRLLLARESLIRTLGTSDFTLPATFPPLPQAEMSEQDLQQRASSQRLDLAIARRELDLARQRVPLARLAILQDTEVDVHYEREPDGERTVGPGIELPIPIFNTGRAARTRAEAELLRARHTLRALEAESASMLRVARATVEEARARVEYYRDVVVPRRERIVALTTLEHNAMLAGVFQLLQSKRNEMDARRELIDAQRDYWSARTDLDRALNGIGREQ